MSPEAGYKLEAEERTNIESPEIHFPSVRHLSVLRKLTEHSKISYWQDPPPLVGI